MERVQGWLAAGSCKVQIDVSGFNRRSADSPVGQRELGFLFLTRGRGDEYGLSYGGRVLPVSRGIAAHPWDIRGAKAAGLMGAYINRDSVPYGETAAPPDLEVSKLTELAARLGV